jgi:hypothetical protein
MTQGINYLSIGLFFAALYITMDTILTWNIVGSFGPFSLTIIRNGILSIIMFVYLFMVGVMCNLSLKAKISDKKFQTIYYSISSFLGLYGFMVVVLMIVNLKNLVITNFGYHTLQ